MRTRKEQLIYRGYSGTVHFSSADMVFWGKLDGIRATVTYEGTNVESLVAAFKEAIDDYLDMCKQEGLEPEKPFKGTFNVRMPTALHRELAHFAQKENINLNRAVQQAVEHFLHCKVGQTR